MCIRDRTGAIGWVVYVIGLNSNMGTVLANLTATFALKMCIRDRIISVEKVADRRSERDSGDERHDVSDDDLIVEDGGTKGEYNQRQQRYECTSQDIRDKLGILMAL